jgi:peptidyl-prolyl cis-trans isomerase D
MKKYYEENKNNYKNANGVILSFKEAKDQVKRDILAEKNRKAAILAYKKLKAGKDNFELITVTINNNLIPLNKMNDLIANGYIKPFINNNEYISAKLVEEIKPAPKPFKEAKAEVIKTLMDIKTTQELQKEAQKELKNFKGKDIGFVTKYDPNKIPNLNPMQATEFLFTEFSLFKAKNYILVPAQNPQKAVLYKITEQKLLDKTKYEKNKKQISLLATQTLNAVLVNDLIKDLMAKFNIVTYVK